MNTIERVEKNRRLLRFVEMTMLLGFGLLIFFCRPLGRDDPRDIFLVLFGLFFLLVGAIFEFLMQRCPVCHRSFGKEMEPLYCLRCGTPFDDPRVPVSRGSFGMLFQRFFRSEIFVEIHPEIVTIRYRDNTLTLQPIVDISVEEASPKIVGIGGEAPRVRVPYKRINLFCPATFSLQLFVKHHCLLQFFLYAIRKVVQKNRMIRPVIMIKGLHLLNEAFCGYQDVLFYQAVAAAGASKVQFIDHNDNISS